MGKKICFIRMCQIGQACFGYHCLESMIEKKKVKLTCFIYQVNILSIVYRLFGFWFRNILNSHRNKFGKKRNDNILSMRSNKQINNDKMYYRQSKSQQTIDSFVYFKWILIENEIILQDLENAESFLEKNLESNNSIVFLVYGKVMKKEKWLRKG